MESVVLSGTGYFVPSDSVSTEEIVASFNEHVKRRGQQLSLPLENDPKETLQESCADFVVRASGIKNRRVIDKKGILRYYEIGNTDGKKLEDQIGQLLKE